MHLITSIYLFVSTHKICLLIFIIINNQIRVGIGEQLTEIKGTFGRCDDVTVIKSLSFKVNENDFDGPYGDGANGTAFSLPVIKGKITGFFGNEGELLDSLGVFIASP